jgi:hypothetical protein
MFSCKMVSHGCYQIKNNNFFLNSNYRLCNGTFCSSEFFAKNLRYLHLYNFMVNSHVLSDVRFIFSDGKTTDFETSGGADPSQARTNKT